MMSPDERSVLDGALKVGEASTNMAIKYSMQVRELRRAMMLSILQLKSGQPARALESLEAAIHAEAKRK